jgi:glycosyltransferase involved in cell wall biosynthesis
MNIAIFASAFHPHFGGVEELVRQLALELRRQGHEAIVLTNRWPRSLPKEEMFEGIPVYRLPFRTPDAGTKSRVSYLLTSKLVDRDVAAILKRHSIDVLHVQCVSCNGHYALRASRALKLPLVTTLQGELTMDATKLFERSTFARETLRQCMQEAQVVTGCSAKTLADGERFLGRAVDDAQVVFNGASLSDFASAKPYAAKRPYIFAMGRLVPQKGFDVLLRALKKSQVDWLDLLLAGDGSERAKLEGVVAELGLGGQVSFLGRADRQQVPSFLSGCAFFVIPSRTDEGMPVVCAEAMAAGKAIIGTRVGGVPEIVSDGETGLLVGPEDVEALASAIRRLAGDESLSRRLGEAGRAQSERFSWPRITREYLQVYGHSLRRDRKSLTGSIREVSLAKAIG